MNKRRLLLGLALLCAAGIFIVAEARAAKGGNGGGGKPGGGGTPADPAIAFMQGNSVKVMDEDGSNVTSLVSRVGGHVAWSPDGTQLVYYDGPRVYIINSDGSGNHLAFTLPGTQTIHNVMAWSPVPIDGEEKLALCRSPVFGSPPELYVVNLDGTDLTKLTDEPETVQSPSWSPTGDRICVRQWRAELDAAGHRLVDILVHELELDTNGDLMISASTDLTASGPLADEKPNDPQWAKTQDLIAVHFSDEVWIIPTDNPAAAYRVLAGAGGAATGPSWSPDDSKILYSGWGVKKSGQESLHIVDLATGNTFLAYEPKRGNLRYAEWRR